MKGSAGGKATALIFKKLAHDAYYKDPVICYNCQATIQLNNKKPSTVRKQKFCSHRCSAIYINKRKPKKEKIKKVTSPKPVRTRTNFSKKEIFENHKDWNSARAAISKHARRVFEESGKIRKCGECGYDKYTEVCHIKSVSSFEDTALLSEINHIDNLVPLCPNHHWEFDKGLIKIQENTCSKS